MSVLFVFIEKLCRFMCSMNGMHQTHNTYKLLKAAVNVVFLGEVL